MNMLFSAVRATLRYWPVLLILYLANLGSALMLAVLPGVRLLSQSRLGYFEQAAQGLDFNTIQEILIGSLPTLLQGGQSSLTPQIVTFLSVIFELIFVAPLLAWLPTAFLYGGVLLEFIEAPARFDFRRFVWGCWHWWGAFLLLGGLQEAGWWVGFGGLSIAVLLLAGWVGSWLVWAFLPIIGALLVVWLAVIELSRVSMVRIDIRNPLRGIVEAVKALVHHPRQYALIYVVWLGIWLVVQLVFRVGLLPRLPLEFWPLVLVVQQAFVLLRLWARAGRLAGLVIIGQ